MRLTEKIDSNYALNRNLLDIGNNALLIAKEITDKLGQIEDIEEELGIELATLFKALRSGIHIIDDGYPYNDRVNLIYSKSFPCGFKGKVGDHCVFFKDYGRTWSLTKEEL